MKKIILTLFAMFISSQFISAQDFELVPYRIGNKWGFSDSLKNIKISAEYDDVIPFNRGYSAFKENQKWGIIDIKGNEIIKEKYDSIQKYFMGYFVYNKERKEKIITSVFVYEGNKKIWVDSSGAVLDKKYTPQLIEILDINDNQEKKENKYIKIFVKNGLYGFNAEHLNYTAEAKYDTLIYSFYDDIFNKSHSAYLFAKKDNKWGIISEKEEIIHPFVYEYLYESSFKSDRKIFKQNGKFGILDKNMKPVLDNKFDTLYYKKGNYFVKENIFWGIFDYKLNEVIPTEYNTIIPTQDNLGFIVTNAEGLEGYINKNGEIIIPLVYNNLQKYKYKDAFSYEVKKLQGYFNSDKSINIKPKYKKIYSFNNGYALVITKKGKRGYINEKGEEFFKK